ncbi:MAG: hypothetical protein NT105_03240 [Verrucomicrobia bacterium]|nr:hypothetical protein [Verrucomicrobiota bacterium]
MRLLLPLFLFFLSLTTHAAVVKQSLTTTTAGENLLRADAWRGWQTGFARDGEVFVCDNGADAAAQRGASQSVVLNQKTAAPVVAEAWSKAENVGGSRDSDYALYLDLVYADGDQLWGQTALFNTGTHDWEKRQVVVLPAKPIKSISLHLLLRRHTGKAWFRGATLRQIAAPAGSMLFDAVPVTLAAKVREGFQFRDVAAGSDFCDDAKDLGLQLTSKRQRKAGATIIEADLADTTGKDRAITLVYSLPVGVPPSGGSADGSGGRSAPAEAGTPTGWQWLVNPRSATNAVAPGEFMNAARFNAGANGRLSLYPFAAIARGKEGLLVGIDAGWPAFYRCGFNAATRELFIAFDLGLAPEKASARVRLVTAKFDGRLGFRGALQRYYEIFPDYFRCRTPEQGVWMPFHKISKVEGWEDFGFKFKEGNDETAWDDAHGILTFRYTEPMTWWMRMSKEMPRTMEAAVAEAKRLADAGRPEAKALFTSGYHDENSRFAARLLDTPWCNGAVWSMNSMPGIKGDVTDWSLKWGAAVREKVYGPNRKGDLDGEYIDSSEGYVTDELDFRRENFAAARLPLTFSPDSRKPAIFRGCIIGEYNRQMAEDVHAMGKLMMANSTPIRLCWLAPWLDVMGTETDWNPPAQRGKKRSEAATHIRRPMSDADLLYRRAMCGPKPYCFLMNSHFPAWPSELTEKFMKRSLAYGMFPGFFSADASTGHYFSQPALYNRDRPLFKKYIPLCKRVAEAGWQPLTRARSNHPRIYVERFGEKLLTVFHDAPGATTQKPQPVTITLEGLRAKSARELLSGRTLAVRDGQIELSLAPEDVAALELE